MKKRIIAAILGFTVLASSATAQQQSMPPPAGMVAILCAYNASPPTLLTARVGLVQCDSTGKLIISGGVGSVTNVNLTQILGAAPSLTNPLWVTPATGAVFPASQSGTWTVQPGNTANTTAWLVTGTGGTFPATQSGTWNIGTITTVSTVTNLAQMNGAALLMGNGVTGTGSQRVTIASDNTAFSVNATLGVETTKVIGTVRSVGNVGGVLDAIGQNVAAPANWWQMGCQFNTTPTTVTNGNGSPCQIDANGRVLASLASAGPVAPGTAATKSNLSGNVYTAAGVTVADGQQVASQVNSAGAHLVATLSADPCQNLVKTYTPISITTATTTRIVAPASAKKTYICYLFLTAAAADNVGIVEGTGGTCGTGTAGVIGGTTAANGPNFAANGGAALGNGGYAVAATAGTNVDLCLITSAATPLAGHIAWVQQ